MHRDLQFAFRQLAKRPGFTAVAVLTMALGIGVNTTMFSVLNAFVLEQSPARDSGRLVSVFGTSGQSHEQSESPGDFYDFQKQNTSFEGVAAYDWDNFSLADPGAAAERLAGMKVSGNFFSLFGIPPALGRAIGADDDRPGAGRVAVLSDGFWRTHYAADPGVIGSTVRLDGEQVTLIGVMPAGFDNLTYWGHIDLWQPLAFDGPTRQTRDNAWLHVIGRLKRAVSLGQAQAEANAIAARFARDFPLTDAGNGLYLVLWNSLRTSDVSRRISWLCMGLAGFVLLIACANLANLQLARMAERVREHAVRIALGASRLQLIRQLLVENLLLSMIGGALGVLIASWGAKLIGSGIYITGVQGFDIPVNTVVLEFTLLASVATGIAVGVVPAWIASRTNVNVALKQGSRGSTGNRSRHVFRRALIVSELALALVLMAGAGYFVRGMQRVAAADMGWKPDGLVIAAMTLPYNAKYQGDAQCRVFFDKLDAKLAELPGTQQAAISAYLPVAGSWRSSGIDVEGRPVPARGKEPRTLYNSVTPGFFSTIGMRLVRGRAFTASDRFDSRPVAVINEAMADALWPGEDPIGKRIANSGDKPLAWMEVVGVVNDVTTTLELVRPAETKFMVYRPMEQATVHWFNLAIRSTAPAPTVATALRGAVRQLDSDQPVYAIVSARESMENFTRGFTLTGEMLEIFALIGLALSAVGIYGVIAQLVAQRTSEIGIRMALGAQARDVLWLVFGQGIRLALAGTAIGLVCSWGLVRLLDSLLPAVPGRDPVAVACVAVLMAAVALFACWLPARRATRVNPIIALRAE